MTTSKTKTQTKIKTKAGSPVGGEKRGRGRPKNDARPIAPEAELLDLALDAFADSGFEGMSVRDVCRRLGVSHNLIHQRFGSKEQLWYAAVDHGFGQLASELATAANDAPDDDLERLRAVVIRFLEVSASSPALLRIMNAEAARPGPRLDYLFATFIQPTSEVVAEVLDRLERAGRVRSIPAGLFHLLVAHGLGAPLSLAPLAGKFNDGTGGRGPSGRRSAKAVRTYAESVTDLLLAGLARPPS
jgi:AcrR family transcriptional regulator